MSEWNYIVGAYALTWIGLLGYAVHLARRVSLAAAALTAYRNGEAETER